MRHSSTILIVTAIIFCLAACVGHCDVITVGIITDIHHGGNDDNFQPTGDPTQIAYPGQAVAKLTKAISELEANNVDAIIELGDFVDNPGADSFGDIETIIAVWEGSEPAIPRYHTLGNHDVSGPVSKADYMSAVGMSSEYYSFDVGNIHFVIMDTVFSPVTVPQAQLDWLETDLTTADAAGKFSVVCSHYSFIEGACGRVTNADDIQAILADHRVILGLNGHLHPSKPPAARQQQYVENNVLDNDTMYMTVRALVDYNFVDSDANLAFLRLDIDESAGDYSIKGFYNEEDVTYETAYFLVAETYPYYYDSYLLSLSGLSDIAHARDLIEFGPSIGQPLVVAAVSCSPDGVNRNYLAPNKPAWSWHVASFVGFSDTPVEILDGNPLALEADCEGFLENSGGYIGFWSYTVVDELSFDEPVGVDPNRWKCDLDNDNDIDFEDYGRLSAHWLNYDCTCANSRCNGSDLDKNGHVDYNDLKLLTDVWLNPYFPPPSSYGIWFDCWTDCPYQCYGDADCNTTGPPDYYRVDSDDWYILDASLGSHYPDEEYNPYADFDRNLDVDGDDFVIWLLNLGKEDSDFAVTCQTCP